MRGSRSRLRCVLILTNIQPILTPAKKAFVRHAISASEMALFVVPEQLRFTGLPATQLAPICITRLADAGHGALPSDFIKVLMAECSLHRSEEWKEMQTAIKSGNNGARLLIVSCTRLTSM